MSIQLSCPRCKKPVAVSNKKAGTYVHCPGCNGRMWVPKDAAADATHVESVIERSGGPAPSPAPNPAANPAAAPAGPGWQGPLPPAASAATIARVLTPPGTAVPGNAPPLASVAAPPPVTPPATPPVAPPVVPPVTPPVTAPVTPPRTVRATPPGTAPAAPPAAGPMPWQPTPAAAAGTPGPQARVARPKVARFISAEAAESTLKLAPDGKLPQLQLREGQQKDKKEQKPTSIPPAVVFGVVGLGILLSLLLWLMPGSSPSSSDGNTRDIAWDFVHKEFCRNLDPKEPLRPYQLKLRDAQLEYRRGDTKKEREILKEVMDLLRAERGPDDPGLTGSRPRDEKLKEQITILLRGA